MAQQPTNSTSRTLPLPVNPIGRSGPPSLPPRGFPKGPPTIPPNTIPRDPTGPNAATQNALAKASQPQQIMAVARNSYIPIIYGGPERTAGLFYTGGVDPTNNNFVMCLLLCVGPIHLIDPASYQINNDTPPPGVSFTAYTGSQTTVDPILARSIPGFNEPLTGVAYMVVSLPNTVTGFPNATALVYGKLIYDPRDGTQSLSDPTTWKYSDNPALILADFLASADYGARKTPDWAGTVTAAANYCDQTVTGTGGSEKRSILTITLAQKQDVRQWIEALRAYVPAWVDYVGTTAYIIADMPQATVDHVFDSNNIDSKPTPFLQMAGVLNVPNVVEIGYTREDLTPWDTDYAEANTNPAVRRKTRIDMPGIRRYSQAQRFATERLNHYILEDLTGQIQVFEEGLKVMLGDRIQVTDDIGLSSFDARVINKQDVGHGRWTIAFRKYDPTSYSSAVNTVPSAPSTNLPDPTVIQAPTALVLAETYYLENVTAPLAGASGLIYQSRIQASWTKSVHVYPVTYRVKFIDTSVTPNVVAHELSTIDNLANSPTVQQGKTYTVSVVAENSIGAVSSALTGSITAQGKGLPPGNVPAITNAFELGGEIFLFWAQAPDYDTIRYEWRYGPTVGFSWASATVIDKVDGLTARFKGKVPTGTWRLAVKAIDSLGQYSTTETTADVVVTSDANSFIQQHTFTSPNAVNDSQLSMKTPKVWAVGTTGWAETPDSAKLSPTGDIDLRADFFMSALDVGISWQILAKWETAANQRAYMLYVDTAGKLNLAWSTTGADSILATSSVAACTAKARYQVRATLKANNGAGGYTVTFYTGTGGSGLHQWTQLGTAVVGGAPTSVFDSTAKLRIGVQDSATGVAPALSVRFYRTLVMNGINGTIAGDFYPARDAGGVDAASWTSATSGEVWTISYPQMIRTAGGDYPELVANGMMSAATADWTGAGGTATISGGVMNLNMPSPAFANQSISISQPGLYRLSFDITSYTSGTFLAGPNSTAQSPAPSATAVGHYVYYIKLNPSDTLLSLGTQTSVVCSVDNVSLIECDNIVEIPQLEGVWKQRWETDVDADKISAKIPNPMSGGANPWGSYITSVTSRFQMETWDLGATVTGQWSIIADVTILSGTVNYYVETSPDGVTWTRQSAGLAWSGASRMARGVIESVGGAFRVNQPPSVTLTALTRTEGFTVTTAVQSTSPAWTGALVQLVNNYVSANQISATPQYVAGGTTNLTAAWDRVLLSPAGPGLMLQYDFNGSGDNQVWHKISTAARVILVDDWLEYDVFIDPSTPAASGVSNGGMFVVASGVGSAGLTASDGHNSAQPAVGFDATARGMWVSRKINIGFSLSGKTSSEWDLVCGADAASGTAKAVYRNIRVTDGAGTTRLTLWSSGEPSVNTTGFNPDLLVTNVQCGPSNSYRVFVVDNTNTPQAGKQANTSFRGF